MSDQHADVKMSVNGPVNTGAEPESEIRIIIIVIIFVFDYFLTTLLQT